ncbi:MAG: hypothetical protein J7J65_01245 [Candidatus Korarchaeota archaeon]|nr:hypothetical protein [Candidatus Korarchaeota archaeon]
MSAEKTEKITRDIETKPSVLEQIKKEVPKSRVITPQSLAMKYNIRVSVARRLLRQFEKEGLVFYVNGNSRVRIYRGAMSKTPKEGKE